jgi:ubiquinone/menaquinone biosynthesis C-methylase UbiE
MPTIEWNRNAWNENYDWIKDGDEWDGQATFCGQPYEAWKRAIVEYLIAPYIPIDSTALEIAPGHGRWTQYLATMVRELVLVDLSPSCIDYCKTRFSNYDHISYHVNDGASLSFISDESIGFIWSYDSFVHMDPEVISCYFHEFQRVLRPGSNIVIHHANRRNVTLWTGNLLRLLGPRGRRIYMIASMGKLRGHDGHRSDVSKELVRAMADEAGLVIDRQFDSWGTSNEFNCRRFHDCITILRKLNPQ